MAHGLGTEVTMFLRQINRGFNHLVMALLLPLSHGAAGAAEQAGDPFARGVTHHLSQKKWVKKKGKNT